MTKLWEKGVGFDKKIESFTVGNDNDLDQILLPYDCEASIAHVKMLNKMKPELDKEPQRLEPNKFSSDDYMIDDDEDDY